MNNNEHEGMNKDCSMDKSEEETNTASPGEESALEDLFHVLGFKKKKSKIKKTPSAYQTSGNVPLSEDFSEAPDTSDPTVPAVARTDDVGGALPPNDSEEVFCGEYLSDPVVDLPDMEAPTRKKKKIKKLILIVSAVLIATAGFIYVLPYLSEPFPPNEDVVASYNGKNITIEELKNFIALEQAKESEHSYCDKHGNDHTQCTSDEACESHPIDSIEGYQQMATSLAVEQIIQEWAASQNITQREDVQHGIKDLLENASVNQLVEQLHEEKITPESISSWEVQQYYDNNKESYSGKSLPEVESEIRQILVSKKDEDFFSQYIEELKQTAGLQVNLDLLKVTEPTDEEISAYYTKNVLEYQIADKAEALEIKIIAEDAQSTATEAIRKIRSGENFESVAAVYGKDGKASELSFERGSGEAAIEEVLWQMQPGDISDPVANTDGSVSIVKLVGTTKAGARPLSEVKPDIRLILLQQYMEREYTLRKDEALFSVHNRRYTLGDFYTEFKELSSEYQTEFSTFAQKQQLVEQLIAKELLLEETGDSSSDATQQHSYDELKIQYLAQILHRQEVDDKLTDPTEDEMKQYYEENKESYIIPEGVKISLIWIDQGQHGEKTEQAKQKANEALSLLNGGTDFSEVAKKYSEDSSADSGGEIDGIYYQDTLPAELGTAFFALKAGETSGILDYDYGYFIIKVRERTEEQQMTYEESAEIIKEYLSDEKHSQLESEMEQVLLDNANFTVYDKTLRKLLKEQNNQ